MNYGKLDVRSLAIFRIALGLLLLSQAFLLSLDFKAFYGAGRLASPPAWQSLLVGALIYGLIPLFGASLALGFATRLSTLLSFVSLLIVQRANQDILQGGDILLRLLLFWALFLPLGHVWSVDARNKKTTPLLPPWSGLAVWAYTLQIWFVYWFAALAKSYPVWIQSGDALFYALNIEYFTTPFGLYLRQFPDLLRILTFGALGFEFIGPLLLFSPVWSDKCRFAAVVLFMGFHLIGIQALLSIGPFPWICAAAWLVFIPCFFWDWLQKQVPAFSRSEKERMKYGSLGKDSNPRNPHAWLPLDFIYCALIAAALLDVLAWNMVNVTDGKPKAWMRQHDLLGPTLGLEQRWHVYAPAPPTEHGWLVIPSELANGSQVDLFTGRSVSWAKPQDIGAYFGDVRWRLYLSSLFNGRNPHALQAYADYLVHLWNRGHAENQRVQSVAIIYMKQITKPDLTITQPEKEALYYKLY